MQGKFLDPAQGDEQAVLVHIDGLVGLAHDLQVDGIEGQLGQDAGKDGRDAHKSMEQAGDQTSGKARQQRHEERRPDVHAGEQAHDADCAAGAKGAVHGQVCDIKDAVGQVHTNGHDAPDEALRTGAGQRTGQVGKSSKQFQNKTSKRYTFFVPAFTREKRRSAFSALLRCILSCFPQQRSLCSAARCADHPSMAS